jgi:hypothetical protein
VHLPGVTHGEDPARTGPLYERRQPEETLLYQVIQQDWRTFLAGLDARENGALVPRFVVAEFESFLRCGILAHGFVRVRRDDCGDGRLVAFSCKRRGFCGSCLGRRMCDLAVHLVERVIPTVPVRQWVLTVPHALRYRMSHDPALTSTVLTLSCGRFPGGSVERASKAARAYSRPEP